MKNIARKIIHRLGGFVYDDFTPVQQAVILEMQAERARDHRAMMMFLSDIGRPIYTTKE